MPGRNFNSNEYQYGFNGKENDNEVKGTGNSLDFGARIYDPRICRWLSVDPLANKFAYASPFIFVDNNPIFYIDVDGRVKKDANGNVIFVAQGEPVLVSHPSGSTATVQMGIIYADDGTEIQAFKNVNGDKGWDTDCHGVTFAKGQVWINNKEVDKLLKGDGYTSVNKKDAKKGDIVVYRDKEANDAQHSVTIVDVNKDKITVEGQGGLETDNHKDDVNEAWGDKNATQNYYRKGEKIVNEFKLNIKPPAAKKDNVNVGKGGDASNGLGF